MDLVLEEILIEKDIITMEKYGGGCHGGCYGVVLEGESENPSKEKQILAKDQVSSSRKLKIINNKKNFQIENFHWNFVRHWSQAYCITVVIFTSGLEPNHKYVVWNEEGSPQAKTKGPEDF